MRAIITKRRDDGSYPDAGTTGRWVSNRYATLATLKRYATRGVVGDVRVEVFTDEDYERFRDPLTTYYIERTGVRA